jgi:hypothetical protein
MTRLTSCIFAALLLAPMKARTLLTLALMSLLLLNGCNKGDPLPGGYAIFIPAGDDSIMLVDVKHMGVAGPTLTQIGNAGALIFGEIQATPRRSAADSKTPGFFILDSATGTIERGLSREDWLKKLRRAGLQGEPELVYPGRKAPRSM